MVGEEKRDSDSKFQGDGLDVLSKKYLAKTSGSVLSGSTSSSSRENASQKEEEGSEIKETKIPEDYGFKDVLYGKKSETKGYYIHLPSGLIEELDDMLKSLPTGFKSSKSQVIASLLEKFLSEYKERVVTYGSDLNRFLIEKEDRKRKNK